MCLSLSSPAAQQPKRPSRCQNTSSLVNYYDVTSPSISATRHAFGDSARASSVLRASPLDAVLSALCALVLLPVHGLSTTADRTSAGPSMKPGAWTITRLLSTPSSLAAALRSLRAPAAANTLSSPHVPSAESPDAGVVV